MPYFASIQDGRGQVIPLHDPSDEPEAINKFDSSFEHLELDPNGWKAKVLESFPHYRTYF